MSLSPICSIIKDFLVVVREAEAKFAGPRLRDMLRDVGAARLISAKEEFLLLGNDETFGLFVEDRDADITVAVDIGFDNPGVEVDVGLDNLGVEVDVGLDNLGVEVNVGFDNLGVLGVDISVGLVLGDTGFFFVLPAKFCCFLACVT